MGSNMPEMETDRVRLVTHCLVTALFSPTPSTNPGKLNKNEEHLPRGTKITRPAKEVFPEKNTDMGYARGMDLLQDSMDAKHGPALGEHIEKVT